MRIGSQFYKIHGYIFPVFAIPTPSDFFDYLVRRCVARLAPFYELKHDQILLPPVHFGDEGLPPAELFSKLYLCEAGVLPYLLQDIPQRQT